MAVALDSDLLAILACPAADHAPLRPGTALDPDADALTCTVCGRSFPVSDGIPVLLLDEVLPGTGPSTAEPADRGAGSPDADPPASGAGP